MPRPLTRVRSEDPAVNRAQDQLLAAVNPLLRRLGKTALADSTATDVAGLVVDFNALLAALRAAGVLGG